MWVLCLVERVFSEQELAEAGELTVDRIAACLHEKDVDQAIGLVQRFQLELMTMFYSYTGWESSILDCMAELDVDFCRAETLSTIENYKNAPEREVVTDGVAQLWVNELTAIEKLIVAEEEDEAVTRSRRLRTEALALHDGLMSRVTALFSILYERHDGDALNWVLSRVMRPEAMDPDGTLPFREKVENIMMFTRSHLLPFTVVEDEEKVTFMPDPCPSGARLIRAGHYESPRNNAIVKERGALTYGRKELPIYCCHEPAMELSSAQRTGIPLFIVDPPEDVGISPCKVYVYKRPAEIPEEYYQRLGLDKPEDLIAVSQ